MMEVPRPECEAQKPTLAIAEITMSRVYYSTALCTSVHARPLLCIDA